MRTHLRRGSPFAAEISSSLEISLIQLINRFKHTFKYGIQLTKNPIPPISDQLNTSKTTSSNTNDDYLPVLQQYETITKTKIQDKTKSFKCYPTLLDKLLFKSIKQLQLNPDIIIKPADKNLGTVVMSPTTYDMLCKDILLDNTVYKPINLNYPNQIFNASYAQLRLILNNHKVLYTNTKQADAKELSYLAKSLFQLQNTERLRYARFYILPKVHKQPIIGRPIVSCINTITYHTSKYLDNLLQPIQKKLSTVVLSSKDVINKLNHIQLPINSILLSADVKSLYPSIPHTYGLNATKQVLEWFHFDPTKLNLVLELLNWTLKNNFLQYQNTIYQQISGTAMGTPVAVCYANIVLFYLEQTCLQLKPFMYLRYIDDLFVICTNNTQALELINQFNIQCDSIKLDSIIIDMKVNFLDLTISISDTLQLNIQLYQKETNKYLYIPPSSNHRKNILNNFITNEINRYCLYNTNPADFSNNLTNFYQRLCKRGYTADYLTPLFKTLPERNILLIKLTQPSKRQQKKLQPHPVVVVTVPTTIPPHQLHSIFELPMNITQHWRYKRAYGTNQLIIAFRQGKNLQRLLCQDKGQQHPSVRLHPRTEEVVTEGNPH